MEILARTRKLGGSLIVTIPKEIVKEKSFIPGELVKMNVKKIRKSGFGMLRGMRSFSEGDKFRGQLEE